MRKHFHQNILNNPIIAAVNSYDKLNHAISSPIEIVFLLTGNIFNLEEMVYKVKSKDKAIYLHIDLLEGFSRDAVALKYINRNMKPDGIITTKTNLIKLAKDMDIFTIQRLFMLDSLSLDTGIKTIHGSKPDAVEILPGIMPKVIKRIHKETNVPVIAGGLIQDKEDVVESLKAGAVGISTSQNDIWYM